MGKFLPASASAAPQGRRMVFLGGSSGGLRQRLISIGPPGREAADRDGVWKGGDGRFLRRGGMAGAQFVLTRVRGGPSTSCNDRDPSTLAARLICQKT